MEKPIWIHWKRKSIPNALILMADGDCNCYGCCSNVKESLHFPCNCSESQFKYWNKVFAEDTVPAFKLIGIGIVPGMHDNVNGIPHDSIPWDKYLHGRKCGHPWVINIKDPAKIKSFVGEDGYYGKRMDEILDPKFIKELSVCDSKLHILSR